MAVEEKLPRFAGTIAFLSPFLGCWPYAYYWAGWNLQAAQIAGIALSTTSMAVVYAVMVETGLNETELGKLILAAGWTWSW